jgi:hypothetical protein
LETTNIKRPKQPKKSGKIHSVFEHLNRSKMIDIFSRFGATKSVRKGGKTWSVFERFGAKFSANQFPIKQP